MMFLIQVLSVICALKYLGWLAEPLALWLIGTYLIIVGLIAFVRVAQRGMAAQNQKKIAAMYPQTSGFAQTVSGDNDLKSQLDELHKKKFGG